MSSVKNDKLVQIYQSLEQIQNDLYNYVFAHSDFNFEAIEKIVLTNIFSKFNGTECQELTGLCVRTLRNKRNLYGLGNLRPNPFVLLKSASEDAPRETP